MRITTEPRSDQWNADDFVGGPRTFTIAGVKVGTAEQKYDIEMVEGQGRSWRPPLTVLRLLVAAWGDDATTWTGRRVTLYRDPTIRFGKDAVGGIRLSHMSHLKDGKPLKIALTESRGKRTMHTVDPLPDAPTPAPANPERTALLAQIKEAATTAGVELATIAAEWAESHGGQKIAEATDMGGLELLASDLRARADA